MAWRRESWAPTEQWVDLEKEAREKELQEAIASRWPEGLPASRTLQCVSVPRGSMGAVATSPVVEPAPYGASLVPPLPVPAAGTLLCAEIEGLLRAADVGVYVTTWVESDVHTWTVTACGVWILPYERGPAGSDAVVDVLIPAGLACSVTGGGWVEVVAGE